MAGVVGTWVRDLRGRRASSAVLTSALLIGVLVASIGTGYTATRPLNDTGGAVLAKGNTVAYVNGESGRVEAEARALAPGKDPLETVTLSDSRVAVVNNTTQQVWIVDPAVMAPQGTPIERGIDKDPATSDELAIVAGPASGYLVDTDAGTVEEIDVNGAARTPVPVPGGVTKSAVPDSSDGVWVLTEDAMIMHIQNGRVQRKVDSGGRFVHLTLADGRPFAITDSGELLNVAADPPRKIPGEPVPYGKQVVVGSPEGAGRWILIVDRRAGQLIAIDPRAGTRRVFSDLPGPAQHNLGEPVVVGDAVYVPDHATHTLYVRNAATGAVGADIHVPGKSRTFSLEVQGERVWANDQQDRRAVAIGPDGDSRVVDKGTGEGLTDQTTSTDVGDSTPPSPKPVIIPPEPVRPPPLPAALEPDPEPDEQRADERRTPPAPEQVSVPVIRPGTTKDDACQQIKDAGLLCTAVPAGSDGPTDEVIGTDPPGGTLLPPGYRVLVRHYGPTVVPNVVRRFTDDACRELKTNGLDCRSEPNPEAAASPAELDVVYTQDPGAGADVATRSTVTVRYRDRAVLGDYRGRPGAQACADIVATYRRVTCTVAEGQSEAQLQNGQAPGTGYDQAPAPNTTIQMGQTVTITVVKTSGRVPDVRKMSQPDACQTLKNAGYECDPRADAIARNAVVTTQDTAPGTPMDGGTVVIHYAPYEPVPLRLYQSNTGERVYIIRRDGEPHERYSQPHGGILGYGYPYTWEQPGTVMIWDHYCTSDKETCLGWSTNHYQSRDNKPFHDNWSGPQETARFIAAPGPEQCTAAGQVPMSRFANFKGRDRDYTVDAAAPAGYTDYSEFLGCLWPP
ncbi:MAG: PASTA domain-containing protein [Pseudonocardiaceae bacterium]